MVHFRAMRVTLRVAPCKGIQDSLGFLIPGTGFRIRVCGNWTPDSKALDSGFQKQKWSCIITNQASQKIRSQVGREASESN